MISSVARACIRMLIHPSHRPAVLAAFVVAASLSGCAGNEADPEPLDETPWVASVDSSGDTTVVRIRGRMPDALVRTLVSDLRVGKEEGTEEESFGRIGFVLGTADGGLLVHDTQAPAVRLFDAQGTYVRTLGGKGGGPGEYNQINGIVQLPDERIVIWDASGSRLNFYSPSGDFQSTSRAPHTGWFSQNMLFSDATGNLYAFGILEREPTDFTRSKNGYVRMDGAGQVTDSIPTILWREPIPALVARTEGGMSAASVPFAPGNASRLRTDGGLVSGPGDPYTLYLTGGALTKPVRIEREHQPVPVSSTEADERRASIMAMMERNQPGWKWDGAPIPTNKPAYRGLSVGDDGRIWVLISSPAERIPADEMPPVREGAPPTPQLTTREPTVYDVFSPSGMLLGRVAPPRRTRIYGSNGRHVWGVMRDSTDVEYAVRFRVEPALPESP